MVIPVRAARRRGVCNRYTLIDPESAFRELTRILGVPVGPPAWVTARYNLGLMQMAPAVVAPAKQIETRAMQFGHTIPGVGKVVGNARAETLLAKRTFKTQLASHRCLIPTTGFIDWETDGQGNKWPHLFRLSHGRPYTMAAIWQEGSPQDQVKPHFYIITVAPNDVVGKYHDRMPLILPDNRLARWLDPAPMEQSEFAEIARSYPAEAMEERAISDFANHVKHEGPACLAPAPPRPDQLGLGF
ncbi:MAG: SOS response-associated peptidase [Opitutaceae bacterium]